MKRKDKIQVTFSEETERDIIDYLSTLKKQEIHIVIAEAIRGKMRVSGFYEAARYNNNVTMPMPEESDPDEEKEMDTDKGVVVPEAFDAFSSIED